MTISDTPHHAEQRVAAGGVILDQGGRVLLVQTEKHREWGFPKGHLDPGELPEEAALREVAEETGWRAEIVKRIRETRYSFIEEPRGLINKVVHWYLMRPVELGDASHAHEIHSCEWITIAEAESRLSHREDRELLQEVRSGLDGR